MHDIGDRQIAFIDGGIIAGVFVDRLLKAGIVQPDRVMATDISVEPLRRLEHEFRVRTSSSNVEGAAFGDLIFVAVPPNAVRPVLVEIRGAFRPQALIVSLAAAVPTRAIEETIDKPMAVVRLIPNTPSLVGCGMNPLCMGQHVSAGQEAMIAGLLSVFGGTIRVEEGVMNAATALTAVGPTYVFPVIKAMMDAAARLGMPEADARRAAAETVRGAAELVIATGRDPEDLKMMIGTRTLREEEVKPLFDSAVQTAYDKLCAAQAKIVQAS